MLPAGPQVLGNLPADPRGSAVQDEDNPELPRACLKLAAGALGPRLLPGNGLAHQVLPTIPRLNDPGEAILRLPVPVDSCIKLEHQEVLHLGRNHGGHQDTFLATFQQPDLEALESSRLPQEISHRAH